MLRGKLEDQEFNRNAAVQRAVQHSADEILQLKNTATSLRDELESLRFEKDAAVQQAVQRSADEILQLKNTATSLRDELESLSLRRMLRFSRLFNVRPMRSSSLKHSDELA